MNYEKAIFNLINNYGREVLSDSFQVRAILSDYVGSNIYDSRLVDCFCWLNESLDLLKIKGQNNLSDYRLLIVNFYKKQKVEFSKEEVKDAVNPLTAIIYKEEYDMWSRKKKANVVKKKEIVKKKTPKKSVREVKISNIGILEIESGKLITNLTSSHKNTLYVTCNDRKLDLSKIAKFEGGKISINVKNYHEHVSIYLPHGVTISNLIVNGKETNLNVDKNIKVTNANIAGVDDVHWRGESQNLKINSDGFVDLYCSASGNIDVKAKYSIYYYMRATSNNLNLKLYSSYGKIEGKFSNGKTHPRIIPWIRSTQHVKATSYVEGLRVNYDLHAPYAKVKAK